MTKLPNPRISMLSPLASASVIVLMMVLVIAAASR